MAGALSLPIGGQPAAPAAFRLREDLSIRPGEPDAAGRRGWILEDRLSHRFFRLDAEDAELLRFAGSGDAMGAAKQATAYLGRPVLPDAIAALDRFLLQNHLTQASGSAGRARLRRHLSAVRGRHLSRMVQRYLFVRIPLFRPDGFLTRTLPAVRWLASPAAFWVFAAAAITGGFLVLRQWDQFLNGFPYFFSIGGVVALFLGIAVAKSVHELAHAYTAKAHGCRVPTLGLLLLVFLPLLYTDATDTWRLNRYQRLYVGLAGVAAELALASLALLLWPFLSDGILRSVVFTLATATWLFSLLINLNPLLRFDGYYVLSDWLNAPNLHPRAAAVAAWQLREWLFKHRLLPPEKPRRWMIGFGIAAYLYRLIVFAAIALAVYSFVFKALGLVLLAILFAHFLVLPLAKEASVWRRQHREHGMTKRGLITVGLGALLIAALFVPLPGRETLPALHTSAGYRAIYAPIAGRLTDFSVVAGESVEPGQSLARIQAPDLERRRESTAKEIALLRYQLSTAGFAETSRARSAVIEADLQAAERKLAALQAELARSDIAAPVGGIVVDLAAHLKTADWVAADERLMAIAQPSEARVIAYAGEDTLRAWRLGQRGRFWPQGVPRAVPLRLERIGRAAVQDLEHPALASVYKGPLPVRRDGESLVPAEATFRLVFSSQGAAPLREQRGSVTINTEPRSIAVGLWRAVLRVVNRELSF